MATAAQLITQFELQVGDLTELSSTEELTILNRVYQRICSDRPWEFLKKTAALTQSTSVPYIALPADFGYLAPNYNYSGNDWYSEGAVALVGSTYDPYTIIPFSDRNRYRDASNKAYIDSANNRIYFTKQPTSANAVAFDYVAAPVDLTTSDSPAFPARFHPIIVYGMAAEDFIIQLSDKAKSYAPENEKRYKEYLADMASWNAAMTGQNG